MHRLHSFCPVVCVWERECICVLSVCLLEVVIVLELELSPGLCVCQASSQPLSFNPASFTFENWSTTNEEDPHLVWGLFDLLFSNQLRHFPLVRICPYKTVETNHWPFSTNIVPMLAYYFSTSIGTELGSSWEHLLLDIQKNFQFSRQ